MKSATKFVVVEMSVDKSNSKLISFLESNDYTDIFCLRSLTAHHSVQKYIEDQLKKKDCAQCKPSEQSNSAPLNVKTFGTVNQGPSKQSMPAVDEDMFLVKREMIIDNMYTEHPVEMESLHPKSEPSNGSNTDIRQMLKKCNKAYIKTEPGIECISTAQFRTPTNKNAFEEQEDSANAEKANLTRIISSPLLLTKTAVECLEPQAIDTDVIKCSENTVAQVANVQSPLVFWLKQRTSNQSKREPISAIQSNNTGNGSPLANNRQPPGDQNVLDVSVICTVNDKLHGSEIISIDDSGSGNHEELAQTDLNASDHEFDDDVSEEVARLSTSPNIVPKRSRRSNGNGMQTNDLSKESTAKSNKHSELTFGKDKSAPEKCMVCLKDVNLKRKGRAVLDSLLVHAKIHADMKRFQCIAKGCDYSTVNCARIKIHMKFNHNITGTGKDMLLVINNDLRKSWVQSFERCYPTLHAELDALKRTRQMCPVFQNQTKSQLTEICMVCSNGVNKEATGRNALDRLLSHAKNHADIKQFHCIVKNCDYSSISSSAAKKHIKSVHNVVGTAENKISDELKNAWIMSFQRCYPTLKIELENLKKAKHMIGFASDDLLKDTEKCTICSARLKNKKIQNGKVIRSSAYLFEHAKTHCDLKQYSCPVKGCGYASGSTTSTAEHIKKTHGTDDTPHNAYNELKETWNISFKRCFPRYRRA